MAKRALCLIFAFILSINSFAAAVSDNDGSAFITKAEFDSLKNNFQQQLDAYNTSLDSKVDAAIASYLSGIKIEKNKDIEPYIYNYNQIRWMHGPYMYFTNRRFTEYTTTAGRYVDTTKWQIINPENRRGTSNDGYFWFHDNLYIHSGGFTTAHVNARFYPTNVPKGWGPQDVRGTSSRGPSIFAAMIKEGEKWSVRASDGGFQAERGIGPKIYTRPHFRGSIFPNSNDPLCGVNDSLYLSDGISNTLSFENRPVSEGYILNYAVMNVTLRKSSDGSVNQSNAAVASTIKQAWNPSFLQSTAANLWASGEGGLALKTACGWTSYCGSYYSRADDGLVEDNRWATQTQFNGDMNNFIYSIWGSDVEGDMNVAPPIIYDDYTYIDLSESPNTVRVPWKVGDLSLGAQTCVSSGYGRGLLGHIQSVNPGSTPFDAAMSIPLFYRVRWKDMCSGEFKYNGESLCKSDGYPVVINASSKGNIKLKISYEERSQTDTSVVTLSPDQKIKTFFKNKPFTDSSGTYVKGYTKIDGTGTLVNLNGTEWTEKEITVNIPVEKGASVWMRIDPLTSDGIYCSMTDYSCILTTE